MLKQLYDIMTNEFAFVKGKQLGIAVSGGLDSMSLAHLVMAYGYNLTLVHCNFGLRGEESDQDQAFIEQYSNLTQLRLETKRFDTKAYASQHKLSTQMAARELRYTWFKELVEAGTVDYIATAHHANDCVETFLINLSRGSGLTGLVGIPAINGPIIRPMLAFSREQIKSYANEYGVKWREDSSNATDDYLRNAIRHKVVPELEQLAPDFVAKVLETQGYLKESECMLKAYIKQLIAQLVQVDSQSQTVNLNKIAELPSAKGFLFAWLNPLGFKAWNDIYDLLTAQSGKQIESPSHVLTKDREQLILTPKAVQEEKTYHIPLETSSIKVPIALQFQLNTAANDLNQNKITVDSDLLVFPLQLRHWQQGDRFNPLGMQGSKKVSDYFTDLKIPRPEKEKIWLLCSDKKIVWIVGFRADDRFKTSPNTNKTLTIIYTP